MRRDLDDLFVLMSMYRVPRFETAGNETSIHVCLTPYDEHQPGLHADAVVLVVGRVKVALTQTRAHTLAKELECAASYPPGWTAASGTPLATRADPRD